MRRGELERRGRRLGSVLRAYEPWLVGTAGFTLWIVGIWGFLGGPPSESSLPGRGPEALIEAAYRSLALFLFEYTAPGSPPSFGANPMVASVRYLAPAVAGWTAIRAVVLLYHDQLERLRALRVRNHVVVCGLGSVGRLLTERLCREGWPVVVLERDLSSGLVSEARKMGAVVLEGDARDPDHLRRAGLARARHLVAACGDDGANTEIAVNLRQALARGESDRVLTCSVHLLDPRLCRLLKEQELEASRDQGLRLEFFNVFDTAARALLEEFSPFRADGEPPWIVVVGCREMGQSVVLEAARLWSRRAKEGQRIRMSVSDVDARARIRNLRQRTPQLDRFCDLRPHELDVDLLDFGPLIAGECRSHGRRPDLVYGCLTDEGTNLAAALAMLRTGALGGTPIVACMERSDGLTSLLRSVNAGDFANLRGFPVLERACTIELVLGGTHETLARAIHERYREKTSGESAEGPADPSAGPWHLIPESLRESNRRQADHVVEKLREIGCDLVPLQTWEGSSFRFWREEVERLGEMEHRRWVRERRADGWRFGPEKDPARKVSPHLVPWEDLSDEVREYDRDAIREIPALLARIGLEVRRRTDAAGT